MKVFVAGSTGAIGKSLVPHLLETGHEVVALARTSQKARELEVLGASVAVADALDRDALTAAIRRAEPEVIIHQLTALTGVGNFKKFDEEFALTNRFRTEVTDTMLAAARLVGARRFIAQSFCGWPFAREGGPVKTEEDPLDVDSAGKLQQDLDGNSLPRGGRARRRGCAVLSRCDMGSSTGPGPGSPRMGRLSSSSASADCPSSATAPASGRSSTYSGRRSGDGGGHVARCIRASTTSSTTSRRRYQRGCRSLPDAARREAAAEVASSGWGSSRSAKAACR